MKSEFMHGKDGKTDGEGFYVQPGIYAIPDKLQFVGRFDQFDPNTDVGNDTIQEISGVANWYFAKNSAKWQLEYMRRNNEATTDENVILVNLQAAF